MKDNIGLRKKSLAGFFIAAIVNFIFCSCSHPVETQAEKEKIWSEKPPMIVMRAIEEKFPGAVPYNEGIDSLVDHLKQFGIPVNTMLWGQSTCVDDIINTKNKLNSEIKGPFNFGGLAGLPFTGITGLDAFSHHVPEHGTAVLFVGPHIGYNETEGWGKILRHNQQHPTTCCGALYAAVSKLRKGELSVQIPGDEDYQEERIEQLAIAHRDEILLAKEPLAEYTRIIYREAVRQLSGYASRIKERHFKYAVIVGGIIVNTDFMYKDYVWIESVSILDVEKNVWIEGNKPNG